MTLPIFRPAAAADVEDGFLWYEAQRAGLGGEFLEEVAGTLHSIMESPHRFPVLHRQTRRALVRRFPYGLFYRIIDDRVIIVACMHAKRDPRRWQVRR